MRRVPPSWEEWHDTLASLIETARTQGSLKANALREFKLNGKSSKCKELWTMYFKAGARVNELRDQILGVTFEE